MSLLVKKFLVVGLTVTIGFAPVTGHTMSEFGRKRTASVCTALLAMGTVAMVGVAQYSGKLQERGFSARVVGSNRRAIVAFLAKGLGLKSEDGGEYQFESQIEAEGFDPDYFKDFSAEMLDAATVITEESDGRASGFIMSHNRRTYFKMLRTKKGRFRFTVIPSSR